MEVISLNTNKQKVAIIDSYKSFIWNDRYENLGDFELYIPASCVETLANIHQDYYIQCSESDRTMIVEKVNYKTDFEDGNYVIISGHSLEAILGRRIVWNDDGKPTQINATKIADPKSTTEDSGEEFFVWQAIEYLLKLYIIDPEACGNKKQRQIPGFVFEVPTDANIYFKTMSACSYQGDNLYDVINSICKSFEFSFKVTLDNETGNFVFSLYKGVSHLASQTVYPYVCFSQHFDNLNASDSSLDMSTYKNMAYYKGNGSKYVVKEFDEKEIVMETGFVRIKDNKVWAVNTDYGHNETATSPASTSPSKVLDWAPSDYNENWDEENPTSFPDKYKSPDLVSRTEIGGALLTEDKSFYLATEPETASGSEEDYNYVLLYSSAYETITKYYRCNSQTQISGYWDPTKWDRVDIRVTWGTPEEVWSDYVPGTEDEPVEHKKDDVAKYNNMYWSCLEDHTTKGEWDATKWVEIVTTHDGNLTFNVLNQTYKDQDDKSATKHCLWSECVDWEQTKQYKRGNFVTFNDASTTGKITIYRKTANDAVYNSKKKYARTAVVWFKNKMYVRKQNQNNKKGISPTNSKYWTELKDKYKIFAAQQWEALDDIEVEQYDILGSVQDEVVGGLNRREMFVDASSVPSTYNYFYNDKKQDTVDWLVDDGVMMATVKDMALAELTAPSNRMTKGLEAEIEYNTNFKFRVDYNIGDIVEVRDIYGYYDSVRVKEFIISDDDNGTKCYPTFEAVEASTITTRLLEVNDELLGNTLLVKIPESTRFTKTETIAVAVKDDTTYYLKSFIKKVTTDSEYEKGKKVRRDLHLVAWITTDDIYTDYEEQKVDDILKSYPTIIGEPLFYINIDVDTNTVIPGVMFPSWAPPYGTDLGLITQVDVDAFQYNNILIANI